MNFLGVIRITLFLAFTGINAYSQPLVILQQPVPVLAPPVAAPLPLALPIEQPIHPPIVLGGDPIILDDHVIPTDQSAVSYQTQALRQSPNLAGAAFLHSINDKLHLSKFVEAEQKRRKQLGLPTSQRPIQKIAALLDYIQQMHLDAQSIDILRRYLYENYIIDEKTLSSSQSADSEKVAAIIRNQKHSLDRLIEFFTSSDADIYPIWAKYWALEGMLRLSIWDKDTQTFPQRSNSTTAAFPELNHEALAYAFDIIISMVNKTELPRYVPIELKSKSFPKLYAWGTKIATEGKSSLLLNTAGIWIKFPMGSDPQVMVDLLERQNTNWCIAAIGTARSYLDKGDIYIYFSYDSDGTPSIPRVAIRLIGKNIDEIRGVLDASQNLDPYIAQTNIIPNKLNTDQIGTEEQRKLYAKIMLDEQFLNKINIKVKTKLELSEYELRFIYELDRKVLKFGNGPSPILEKILLTRNIKQDVSSLLNLQESQIYVADLNTETLDKNIRYYHGNVTINSSHFSEETIINIPFVRENLHISSSAEQNSSLGKVFVEHVGGDLWIANVSSIKELFVSRSIDGLVNMYDLILAERLVFLQTVGGKLDLRSLKSATKGIVFPQTVGGNLDLRSLKSPEGIVFPQKVGGNVDLGGLNHGFKEVILPYAVGGNVYVRDLDLAKDLKLPQSFGGELQDRWNRIWW